MRALVALGRDWRSWVLCDRDPVEVWTDGPVLLIGDAAHPMLQYAAQGAAMALEDAICLGEVLDDPAGADLAGSFARFQVLRTARVQRISRMMGTDIYHNAGPAAKERNAQLGTLAQPDLHAKLDWLYLHGHETADAR